MNPTTDQLPPYPMEELKVIKDELKKKEVKIYDFGTGDPLIPLWPKLNERLIESLPAISQYPSVLGNPILVNHQKAYLERRFGVNGEELVILPTSGSKEGIFHIALTLVGRKNRKTVIYPNPGYPVYKTSILYAGGKPHPFLLGEHNRYQMEPWTLPKDVVADTVAIWINYPHNPTGAMVDRDYLEKLVIWASENDVIILSDECYVDIYDPTLSPEGHPLSILSITNKGVIAFFSLSKRSGMTGFRSGFLAGDRLLCAHLAKARANFGLAQPEFVQKASELAWQNEEHVTERRHIFFERMTLVNDWLKEKELIKEKPKATFYCWAKVPSKFDSNDIEFCKALANLGVITTPSQWLSEGVKGFFRMALVPTLADTQEALSVMETIL